MSAAPVGPAPGSSAASRPGGEAVVDPRADDAPEAKRARTDVEDELDIPIAGQEDAVEGADESAAKRQRTETEETEDEGGDPAFPREEVGVVEVADIVALDRRGRYDVCEMFSPPRIVETASKSGLRAGWSMDVLHVDGVTRKRWDLLSG